MWIFMKEWHAFDRPFLEEDARNSPELAIWLNARREMGDQEVSLLWMCMYTDDPLWCFAGADRMVRANKLWLCLLHRLGLKQAELDKVSVGLAVKWNGMIQNGFFGLTIIPAAKSLNVVVGINAMLNGSLLFSEALSLLGLCEHVRYATAMKNIRLNLLWKCLPEESAPDQVMSLSKPAKERALKFRDIVGISYKSPADLQSLRSLMQPNCPLTHQRMLSAVMQLWNLLKRQD